MRRIVSIIGGAVLAIVGFVIAAPPVAFGIDRVIRLIWWTPEHPIGTFFAGVIIAVIGMITFLRGLVSSEDATITPPPWNTPRRRE